MSREIMKAPELSLLFFYNFDYKMSTKPLKLLLLFLLASLTVSQWTANGTISSPSDVNEINFSPDGKYIVVACQDNEHCIYNVQTRNSAYCISAGDTAQSAKFSPNQQMVAFGIADGTVKIRDATNHPSYPLLKNLNVPFSEVQ